MNGFEPLTFTNKILPTELHFQYNRLVRSVLAFADFEKIHPLSQVFYRLSIALLRQLAYIIG